MQSLFIENLEPIATYTKPGLANRSNSEGILIKVLSVGGFGTKLFGPVGFGIYVFGVV